MITNEKEAAKFDGGIRQVYVCRLACNTNAQCPQAGDVCCLGVVYGKTYNKKGGCAPPGSCEMGLVEEEADSGAPADGGGGGDAGGDRPADAGVTPDVVAPDGISGGTAG